MTINPLVIAHATFTLRAIRNISGHVRIYDRASRSEMFVARIIVQLKELSRECITDDNGAYLFRDLPAGSYTLTVLYEGEESRKEIMLLDSPAFPKSIDIDIAVQ